MDLKEKEPILNLISEMMRIENRIDLQSLRKELSAITRVQALETVFDISQKIEKSTSKLTKEYIEILKDFS